MCVTVTGQQLPLGHTDLISLFQHILSRFILGMERATKIEHISVTSSHHLIDITPPRKPIPRIIQNHHQWHTLSLYADISIDYILNIIARA